MPRTNRIKPADQQMLPASSQRTLAKRKREAERKRQAHLKRQGKRPKGSKDRKPKHGHWFYS